MPRPAAPPTRILSVHAERLLDDRVWLRFERFLRRRPGGLAPLSLLRPPDRAFGEDEDVWLERARTVAALAPVGLHTHWTSPTHARPTGGTPAERVRTEAAWMRGHGLEPAFFCGGGWYSDDAVRAAVAELGLVDCTPRGGVPAGGVLPTTHTLGALARAQLRPLPPYVHAYLHDTDLVDPLRRTALTVSLRPLRARSGAPAPPSGLSSASAR